jgi:glutamyl-tRNA synthetase
MYINLYNFKDGENVDYLKLANLLFPNPLETISEYEKQYPSRTEDGNFVTRIAPSPTGYIHLGNLYSAIINEKIARQNNGVFYLRIDDTDKKREVPGAFAEIVEMFKIFGFKFDEGAGEGGKYGPYKQSKRKEIYHAFAKNLVLEGKAYPCFCNEEQLKEMRKEQASQKSDLGYYGEWATHRDITVEEIKHRIKSGEKFVLRYRAQPKDERNIVVNDGIKGRLELSPNKIDFILLKSDGLPTYHFSHVIDDYLMRTTHVIRGEEWLSSLPIHVDLFNAFGWKVPSYSHTPQLLKSVHGSKRKLSKRDDPEASLSYFLEEGYDPLVLKEYLMSIINSNFDDWRRNNKESEIEGFKLQLKKISKSGALFDINKLNAISKNFVANLSVDSIYFNIVNWAKKYNKEFEMRVTENKNFTLNAINVFKVNNRKDFYSWKQAIELLEFFYIQPQVNCSLLPRNVNEKDRNLFLDLFIESYNCLDDKEKAEKTVIDISNQLGYSTSIKKSSEIKNSPSKGHINELYRILRIGIVGRVHTPDLWEIMKLLGNVEVKNRLIKLL